LERGYQRKKRTYIYTYHIIGSFACFLLSLVQNHTLLELIAILQHIFGSEPPVYTKAVTSSPSSNVGSPIKENGMSPGLSHLSMPPPPPPPPPASQSPRQSSAMVDGQQQQQQLRWPGEGTAYYNLNQDMAVSDPDLVVYVTESS
jgi:ESCRT-I complex subunit TSG101